MSWRAATDEDVYAALNDAEGSTLREVLLASGQGDPLGTALGTATGKVRDAIRSNPDNTLSPVANEVPEGLVDVVVALALHTLGLRMSAVMPISEDRKDAWRAAREDLKAIAAGRWAVEAYGSPEETPAPRPRPGITARDRRFARNQQDGI